jgi:hypothetical protein
MLWDDINPSQGGTILYYSDSANSRFIVTYDAVPIYGTSGCSLSFQVVLYPNGRVDMNYSTLIPGSGSLASNTIGIENSAGSDGLLISFNNSYLHNALTVAYIPPSHWLLTSLRNGSLGPGADTFAVLTFSAAELDSGAYTGHLELLSNDPDESQVTIPVTFNVGLVGGCQYVIGDINHNGIANGIDVVYGVGYFKGGPEPPFICDCPPNGLLYAEGDVNGNCAFNGIDITFYVGYLKGGPVLRSCQDCPPEGLLPLLNPAVPISPSLQPDGSSPAKR